MQTQSGWILALMLLMGFECGCSSKASRLAAREEEINKFKREESQLFNQYLFGDLEQARQSLKQTIQHIEKSNALDEDHRAGGLALMYYRLFVLEKRAGHDADAEIALVKARFWQVKNCELNNLTNDEIVIRITIDAATAEKNVNDFDEGGNNGNKPKYLQYITNRLDKVEIFTNTIQNLHHEPTK